MSYEQVCFMCKTEYKSRWRDSTKIITRLNAISTRYGSRKASIFICPDCKKKYLHEKLQQKIKEKFK